ncbi:MAG: DNA-binding protein [Wenzhouxiangellaceae bacterium]
MERIYQFTLKFAVPVRTTEPDDWIDGLAETGCDDALVGTGTPGRLALEFDRTASDADSAMRSAVADVQRAIPEARLIEAGPDYVGLTEIAEFLDISRQAMRKIMAKNIEAFPLPVHQGNPSIWHLKDVLEWMRERQGRKIDAATEEVSVVAYRVNSNRRAVAA